MITNQFSPLISKQILHFQPVQLFVFLFLVFFPTQVLPYDKEGDRQMRTV